MQTVSSAWSAEEKDSVRNIAHNLQVSWHKQVTIGARVFTIGVSLIGGDDIIGINPGAIGGPLIYKYFDESAYVQSLEWERGLNLPLGGLSKALAEATLDNNSGRFTPESAGGNSELYTAIVPRRPMIINAGFNFNGIDQTIPQFSGVFSKQPRVDLRKKTVDLRAADYVDFFQNKYLDQEVMFTGQRTDQLLETLFSNLGMSTAQYSLDQGLNTIPFGIFEKGQKFADVMHDLAVAENGHIYQDEQGIFRFENRQHWYASPFDSVQRIILTSQVLEAESPSDDHIINVVEIKAPIREKQPLQTIYSQPSLTYIEVPANSTVSKFFEFQDPALSFTNPTNGGSTSFFVANSASDESGTDRTANITFSNKGSFARAVKYDITNNLGSTVYVTQLVIGGRVAKETGRLYFRDSRSSSRTAYEEQVLSLDNPYIQDVTWADSYTQLILQDFSSPESLQKITIRAIPELQMGDLISWQGRYWRVYDIKSKLSPEVGFIQEVSLVKRTIQSYFTIGISTVGGSDQIAP